MGLGLIMNELRFNVWVENRDDSKLGMRVQRRISWRSLFSTGSYLQQHCVERFLSSFGIPLQEKYYDGESIRKWLLLLEQLEGMYAVRSSLTDQSGLHMMTWVMDNPVPKDWGEFIEWVKAYDGEREMVD